MHPINKNEVIVWNLEHDPRELIGLNAQSIRERMFSKMDALAENVSRLPIKTIHLNKSPIVIRNLKTLLPAMAQQWDISVETAMKHAKFALELPDLNSVWQQVYHREYGAAPDVDQDLYNGFVGDSDRRSLQNLTIYSGEKLAKTATQFQDARLDELLFRYRARNFPATLTEQEIQRWETLRASRFFDGSANAITVDDYFAEIDHLSEQASEQDEEILTALYEYAENIVPVRGG